MGISFHPEAAQEYEQAIDYYEGCQLGLGKQLVQEIDAAIQHIVDYPHAWSVIKGNLRRILVRRFPFGLLYVFENNEIQIIAVMHLNRSPNYWEKRL